MIINTGGRTDTVQYYTDWLLRRFAEGYVLVRNPRFPEKVTRYELDPAVVDCVVFCSKNYAPILPRLHEITDRFNTYFFYTITAYGRDMEPGVPDIDASIKTLIELERIVGGERIVWRYDPVLLSERYTTEVHRRTFDDMARRLAPHVSRCVFSFVEPYRKLDRNMPELLPLMEEERVYMVELLGGIACEHGLRLQACATREDFSAYGVTFRKLAHRGMREGCACMEMRDIGAYNSCPNGCRYCYANADARGAARIFREQHDPASPLMLGHLRSGDVVAQATQRSYLAAGARAARRAVAPGQGRLEL